MIAVMRPPLGRDFDPASARTPEFGRVGAAIDLDLLDGGHRNVQRVRFDAVNEVLGSLFARDRGICE